jgi:hypothetical protein
MDEKKIIKNYKKTYMMSDIIAYIPLIVAYNVSPDSSNSLIIIAFVLEFLVFAKWFSLLNVMSRVERVFTENDTVALYWPIMQLFVIVFFFGHIVGLIYNVRRFLYHILLFL